MEIQVLLTSTPDGNLFLPNFITIPAGETRVAFRAEARDDSRIDGNLAVQVTASAPGLVSTTTVVQVLDNENNRLSLDMQTTLLEGGTATGRVIISGTLLNPLEVTLVTLGPAAAPLINSVTIPAGQTSVTFQFSAADNTLRDGSRTTVFRASANGFIPVSATLSVRDNEIGGYRFGGFPDIIDSSLPISVTVAAVDIEGSVIPNFNGIINLSLVLPGGATLPVTPASAVLSGNTGWAGNITLPSVSVAPLKFRASDASGTTSDSTEFDIMRTLPLTTSGMVWDAQRGRIYASVPANGGATYSNRVVAIDPTTLQIVNSVVVNQDPGQIVITSGSEAIYVALRGNGTITKIRLSDFTVEQNFAIGTSSYGTQFAEDMCTVAGQPNLLLVSRYRKSVSPAHDGVAVFDNGIARSVKTQDHTGSNFIEPSADPSIFFGYCNESSEFGVRRLRLSSQGIAEIEVKGDLISGYGGDIRSSGNKILSVNGSVTDGARLKRLGSFQTRGVVCPDEGLSRAFFIEETY